MSASPEAVRSEALALRDLLVRHSRRVAGSLRPVHLGLEEPALVRTFWEALGWSPLFAERLGEPELEHGRQMAERYLAKWRSWNSGFCLTLAELPHRFRLAAPDHQGVGFSLTDETSTAADPPVLFVSADEGTREPLLPSYLRLVGHELLQLALSGWYRTPVEFRPSLETWTGAIHPFPHLVPAAMKLGDEVWALPWNVGDEHPKSLLYHTRYEALLEWLARAERLEALHIPTLPGKVWTVSVEPGRFHESLQETRVLPGFDPGEHYCVGLWEGIRVLLATPATGPQKLAANVRHADHVTGALKAQGWLSTVS